MQHLWPQQLQRQPAWQPPAGGACVSHGCMIRASSYVWLQCWPKHITASSSLSAVMTMHARRAHRCQCHLCMAVERLCSCAQDEAGSRLACRYGSALAWSRTCLSRAAAADARSAALSVAAFDRLWILLAEPGLPCINKAYSSASTCTKGSGAVVSGWRCQQLSWSHTPKHKALLCSRSLSSSHTLASVELDEPLRATKAFPATAAL